MHPDCPECGWKVPKEQVVNVVLPSNEKAPGGESWQYEIEVADSELEKVPDGQVF